MKKPFDYLCIFEHLLVDFVYGGFVVISDVDGDLSHVCLLQVPTYRLDMLQSPWLKFIKKKNQSKVDLENFIIKACKSKS